MSERRGEEDLHGGVHVLQLIVFTLPHGVQGGDQLTDCAGQLQQQLRQAEAPQLRLLLLLHLLPLDLLRRDGGRDACEGAGFAEQTVELSLIV